MSNSKERIEAAVEVLPQVVVNDDDVIRTRIWRAYSHALVGKVLAATDEFDATHGIVRVRVDDELIQKIAAAIDEHAYNGADWDHGEPPDHERCEYCVCGWASVEIAHTGHVAAAVVAVLQEGAEK